MRFEDRDRFFEAAFAKIEPKNEAEREKLEKLRAKIQESTESTNRIIEQHLADHAKREAETKASVAAVREQARRTQEERETFFASFDEQADLIERIVALGQSRDEIRG